jgi:hypothetical protein
MCHAVRKNGYGNPHVDKMALFMRIKLMDKLIHTTRYNHVGAMIMMDYWQGMSRDVGGKEGGNR